MSISQQADQQVFHKLLLTDYDLPHLKRQHVDKRALTLDPVVQFFDVHIFHLYVFFIFSRNG